MRHYRTAYRCRLLHAICSRTERHHKSRPKFGRYPELIISLLRLVLRIHPNGSDVQTASARPRHSTVGNLPARRLRCMRASKAKRALWGLVRVVGGERSEPPEGWKAWDEGSRRNEKRGKWRRALAHTAEDGRRRRVRECRRNGSSRHEGKSAAHNRGAPQRYANTYYSRDCRA